MVVFEGIVHQKKEIYTKAIVCGSFSPVDPPAQFVFPYNTSGSTTSSYPRPAFEYRTTC